MSPADILGGDVDISGLPRREKSDTVRGAEALVAEDVLVDQRDVAVQPANAKHGSLHAFVLVLLFLGFAPDEEVPELAIFAVLGHLRVALCRLLFLVPQRVGGRRDLKTRRSFY